MLNLIATAFVVTLTSLGAFMQEARAQGKCWNGTIVTDLKDCPKQPGTKLQSPGGGGKSAVVVPVPVYEIEAVSKGKRSRQLQVK